MLGGRFQLQHWVHVEVFVVKGFAYIHSFEYQMTASVIFTKTSKLVSNE